MGIRQYILVDKKPVVELDLLKWSEWLEKNYYTGRIVKQTHHKDIFISTVFLGLDHRFGPGTPVLFETMIFGGKHDQYQERYETWEAAERGHEKALKLVRASEWRVINGGKENEAS